MVNLASLAQDVDMQDGEIKGFLDKINGEVIYMNWELENLLSETDLSHLADWQQEEVEQLREAHTSIDWIRLPSSFEVDERETMFRFVKERVKNKKDQEDLNTEMNGRGGARRFKDLVFNLGLEEKWFSFKMKALEAVLKEWLEENGIEYVQD